MYTSLFHCIYLISCNLSCTCHILVHLRGVHVVGEKLFQISGEFPQLLEWEEYGLRIQVPEGATSKPCDIAIKVIVAGQFEFPEDTDLVSAVYAISVSKKLIKPVMLEIQHCVAITREEQSRSLSFVRAQCNQPQLPYQFELLDNGTFPPHSDYGKIACGRFSLVAVAVEGNNMIVIVSACTLLVLPETTSQPACHIHS